MRRPLALTIVAWLFVLGGLWGAVSILEALWVEHKITLAVDTLGLWVGPGLLRWDPRYYRWAQRLLVLDMVLASVVLLLALHPLPVGLLVFSRPIGSVPRVLAVGASVALLGVSLWQYLVLRRPDIRQVFEAKKVDTATIAPSV